MDSAGAALLFGRVGLVLGALQALYVGNPMSELNSAPESPPSGWGQVDLVPQGANATLLHSTTYFDGADRRSRDRALVARTR